MVTGTELLHNGGEWLGATRNHIKRRFINGGLVTWGSKDILLPSVTVGDMEQIAAEAVAAYINEQENK